MHLRYSIWNTHPECRPTISIHIKLLALWILFIHAPAPSFHLSADPDEDAFVNLYGSEFFYLWKNTAKECAKLYWSLSEGGLSNDVNSSGIWQQVRDLVSGGDDEILRNISSLAHHKVYVGEIDVDNAVLDARSLQFSSVNYKNIRADVIVYKVVKSGTFYFFLTKGLRPDCVFYLMKLDSRATLLQLGKHICGISILEK